MRNFTNAMNQRRTLEHLEHRRMLIAVPFSAPMTIDEPELDEPSGIFAADFNNDGIDELIVEATMMSGFREVSGFHVYGASGGNYRLQQSFSDTGPTVADFDGDGFLDIAAIRELSRSPVIYLNDGAGDFPSGKIPAMGNSSRHLSFRQVKAGDFDNDGDADLAMVVSGLPLDFRGISVSMNNGNGSFGTLEEKIPLSDYRPSYSVADFDADGDDDIVSYSYARESRSDQLVWHESTEGEFKTHLIESGQRSSNSQLRTEDTTGDGDVEIVLQIDPIRWRDDDESTSVFGYDAESHQLVAVEQPEALRDADNLIFLDIDGDEDVDVLRQHGHELQLFIRHETGLTPGDVVFETDGLVSAAAVASLNGDRQPDIALVSTEHDVLQIAQNQGANRFEIQIVTRSQVDNISKVNGADLNDDGRTDLLISGDSLVWYPAAATNGSFEDAIVISDEVVDSSQIVDLDSDGDLDIVTASSNYLAWFENDHGDFVEHGFDEKAVSAAVFDFNDDSDLDVIYATVDTAELVLLENQDGRFVERQRLQLPTVGFTGTILPSRFEAGTLRSDVVMNELHVANQGERGNIVAVNFSQDGEEEFGVFLLPVGQDGSFQQPRLAKFSFSDDDTVTIGTGDINRDGIDDVMVSHHDESAVADWIDLSDFESPTSHVVQRCSPECYAISTNLHDVDGDGDLDSISPWAWFENVDGLATKFSIHRLNSAGWQNVVGFFDVDGDDEPDVVIANDNKIGWLRNETPQSDWNGDGTFDGLDIRFVDRAIRDGSKNPDFDFNADGSVNNEDFYMYLSSHVGYQRFDVNLDGRFDSSDLVRLFQASKYEKDEPATWSEGDFDGDNRFDSNDIIAAFAFGYERDPFEND